MHIRPRRRGEGHRVLHPGPMRSRLLNAAVFAVPLTLALPSARAQATTWGWPLPPPRHVVRGFDPPPQPWLPGHRGVDLAGRAGEPVLAAGAGVVSFAGRVARMPVVSVRHPDGLLTTYQPVRAEVRVGAAVSAGEQIGRLVPFGSHCAPAVCLHWGLRRGSDYLDPLALLHLNQVRLLPLATGGQDRPGAPVTAGGGGEAVTGFWAGRRRGRRCRRGGPAPGACRPPRSDGPAIARSTGRSVSTAETRPGAAAASRRSSRVRR